MGISNSVRCYGHDVPAFREVFPKLFRAGLDIMQADQIHQVAGRIEPSDRAAMADYLGPDGIRRVLDGLVDEKAQAVASSYATTGSITEERFRAVFPRVMVAIHNTLQPDQVVRVMACLSAEDIASMSLFFGDDGRTFVFEHMRPDAVRAVLDRTEDWVFLETGRRAVQAVPQYTCTLEKQERVDRKLQGVETIELKYRSSPLGIYMKWTAGPFKGRELLYSEAVLGKDKIRVREGGVLGIVPVTLTTDAPLARRGTKHLVTEVGLGQLVKMIEADYLKAGPKGHIKRINHGIVDLDGVKVYKFESVLPRDRSLGYYCHRMVHYTDYLRALEIKCEVFNFDDDLDEAYYYRNLNLKPGLSDVDFDPKNRQYKL